MRPPLALRDERAEFVKVELLVAILVDRVEFHRVVAHPRREVLVATGHVFLIAAAGIVVRLVVQKARIVAEDAPLGARLLLLALRLCLHLLQRGRAPIGHLLRPLLPLSDLLPLQRLAVDADPLPRRDALR